MNLKESFMIIHSAESRGKAHHGWLQSRHTFSFADYYDPDRMGFGALRVINDDSVAPGMGFGNHPHRDMEIISIPLEGALKHKDSEGNSHIIQKGEVQIMSAGTGIAHSEFNASPTHPVKFLQIWVLPKKLKVKPRYEQKAFTQAAKANQLCLILSPDGRNDSVTINQDAFFSLTQLDKGRSVEYERLGEGTGVYILVLFGRVEINGQSFESRDGVGLKEVAKVRLSALEEAEVLLMEVPL